MNDDGTTVMGAGPGFVDEASQDYRLKSSSDCINAGMPLHRSVMPDHDVLHYYVRHRAGDVRPRVGKFDIGAFEQEVKANE